MLSTKQRTDKRKLRVRSSLRTKGVGRPRLSVFRSNKHIYAQIIDDKAGRTLLAASTLDKDLRVKEGRSGANVDAAKAVGTLVGERAVKAGIKEVRFDRGPYMYHGRVKALADAAREAGLIF